MGLNSVPYITQKRPISHPTRLQIREIARIYFKFKGSRMNEHETTTNGHESAPARTNKKRRRRRQHEASFAIRPRSAVTSGRQLFVNGNPNSAWSRRYDDLLIAHINDISPEGADALSAAQLGLIRRATSIESELERLDAMLSRGEEIDLDSYARVAGHLRRLWETLGLERRTKEVTTKSVHEIIAEANASNNDAVIITD